MTFRALMLFLAISAAAATFVAISEVAHDERQATFTSEKSGYPEGDVCHDHPTLEQCR